MRKTRGGAQSSTPPGTWEAGLRIVWRAGFRPNWAAQKEGDGVLVPGRPPAAREPRRSAPARSQALARGPRSSPPPRLGEPRRSPLELWCEPASPIVTWENDNQLEPPLPPLGKLNLAFSLSAPAPPKIQVFSKEGTTAFGEEKEECKFGGQRTGTLCHKYKHYMGPVLISNTYIMHLAFLIGIHR